MAIGLGAGEPRETPSRRRVEQAGFSPLSPCAGTSSGCPQGWQLGVPVLWGWHGAAACPHCCQRPGQGQGAGHAGDAGQSAAPFHYGQEPP